MIYLISEIEYKVLNWVSVYSEIMNDSNPEQSKTDEYILEWE